jgi:hypothetical protein
MIQQGDGTFARREKLGLCVVCQTATGHNGTSCESECKICGLKSARSRPRQLAYVTKLSHDAKPEGYRIHELKVEKKGHA